MSACFMSTTRSIIGVHLTLLFLCCSLLQIACTTSGSDQPQNDVSESNGLVIDVVEMPAMCKQKSRNGNMLKIHFTGYFENGTEFDASHSAPFSFVLGGQRVIKGWNLGLVNMCVGEKRRLIVPPHLGYEQQGFGKFVGSDEVLTFDVELLDLSEVDETEEAFHFKSLDLDNDGLLQRDEVTEYLKKLSLHLEDLAIQMDSLQGQRDLVNKIMEIHDKNNDGFIGEEEYYSPISDDERQEL